ncbi:MAG: PIG-L family deacetylase, partial [Blastocatellia bacterium]
MNTDKHGSGLIGIGLQFIQPHGRSWKISQTLFVPVCIHLWLISFCLFSFSADATAQVRPVYDRGTTGLVQLLKRLNTSASVMMIGAHPDDEDTALLAYLARGENARTAYLSLTRGDGGQNIIGPELGEALGVIRTEELLQARRLDGAEQYFTRAYDYGFSKTLDEAKQKWDEKIILCDVVRVIREFRPLVVVSQFSGTAADGHGQHQFSGYITPLAIKAAADSTQCRDAGPAWNVRKLYVRHGFRATTEPRLRVNTGKYDPVLGRSYFEIAMEARSQHKSQEQGVLELKGDAFSGLNLVGSETKETGVFDGLNISIKGIAENTNNVEGSFIEKLETLQAIANRVLSEYDVRNPASILPMLTEGYKLSETAEASTRTPASKAFLETKSKQFLDAIRLAAGIQIDAIADKETVIPSEQFGTVVRLFFPLSDSVKVNDVVLNVPQGWTVSPTEPQAVTPQGAFRRETAKHTASYTLKVADDAKPAQPYWLEQQREGDMFRWKNDDNQTLPFQPPVASAKVTFVIHGVEVAFTQPVEYRFADDVRGEIRRPLEVVP